MIHVPKASIEDKVIEQTWMYELVVGENFSIFTDI